MSGGIALTDADRWDWLITLREEAVKHLRTSNVCVVTCSALKKKYRDVIRTANYHHPTVQIHFVFLDADEAVLQKRVAARQDHYMKPEMVRSQFEALELPDVANETDVIKIDVQKSKDEVEAEALEKVQVTIAQYEAERLRQAEETAKTAS